MLLTHELCIQVKYIEVSNPASKPIAYTARLEGHSDFALEAPTIRIEPKGSTRIAVLCKSSTTNPQVCGGCTVVLQLSMAQPGGGASERSVLGRVRQRGSAGQLQSAWQSLLLFRASDCQMELGSSASTAMIAVDSVQRRLSAADFQAHPDQQAGWQCPGSYHGLCPQS